MKNTPLRAAVIGAGMIAREAHIPALKSQPDLVQLTALADTNPNTLQQIAGQFQIPNTYPDVADMLEKEKPDLVCICTPNSTHHHFIRLALEHGANVLCEKPLAVGYTATKELFDLAQSRGLMLVACQTVRYLPEYQAAWNMVQNGILGQIHFAEFSAIRRRGIPKWGNFHRKAASGGGCLADLGVHMIDAAVWLMQKPVFRSVVCSTASQFGKIEPDLITSPVEAGAFAGFICSNKYVPEDFDVEDFAAGTVRFEGGLIMNFKVSWAVNLAPGFSLSLAGRQGGLSLPELKVYANVGNYQADISPKVFLDGKYSGEAFPGHFSLMENILRHLALDEPLLVSPRETLTVAAIIEAAYLSAREGREVLAREVTG